MIKRRLLFLMLPIVISTSLSCKKESKEEQSKLIGTWKKVKEEVKSGTSGYSVSTQTCKNDDTEEYSENGKWTFYDGPVQCSPGTGILKGTWKIAAGNTKIIYTYDDYEGEYESTIEELSDNRLVLVQSDGSLAGNTYRITYQK